MLPTEIFDDIYTIDSRLCGIPEYTCVYLVAGENSTLIETASAACVPAVLEGIEDVGIRPDDISQVVLTHVHLDHAGGAGALLSAMPNARIFVHPRGVKHLVDPSMLIESAERYLGREVLTMLGKPEPLPAHKVRALADGELIRINADRELFVMFAPGHANHHVCLLDREDSAVFTGDAAGMKLAGMSTPLPTTGSPDFDLEKASETILRLLSLGPTTLLFSHFGPTTRDADRVLTSYLTELEEWRQSIVAALKARETRDETLQRITEHFELSRIPLPKDVLLRSIQMNIEGYVSYLQRRRPNMT